MEKTDSQTKFGELLKHITTYLDNEGIEDIVNEKKTDGDPTDEKNVTTSLEIFFKYKKEQHEKT